jgi:DNA repair protein SbcD/Mre11
MKRSLRVLHAADLHLDGDTYGNADERAAQRQRERRVFEQVIDRALTDDVDLVLIAGDLFDHNRPSDDTVAFVRAELGRLRQPLVLLPGNHDCLEPNGVHARHDFAAGARHVHVIRQLDGEVVEFPELDAIVWGRGMREHVHSFRPLAHIPPRDTGRWSLAMGHGFFYEERQRPERSSPIFADEIREAGWDYAALGHHHAQTNVSQRGVAAWYAGAPGTVLRIELSPDRGVVVDPRPL